MSRNCLLIATVLLLSGCTIGFEASPERLSLVQEEPPDIAAQYSMPGIEKPPLPLKGMLRLDFVADVDLIELKIDDGYHTGFDAKICDRNERVMKWGEFYTNRLANNEPNDRYHYSVFLRVTWPNHDYNLRLRPEPVCIRFRAGQMAWPLFYQSNEIVIDREMINRAFDEN